MIFNNKNCHYYFEQVKISYLFWTSRKNNQDSVVYIQVKEYDIRLVMHFYFVLDLLPSNTSLYGAWESGLVTCKKNKQNEIRLWLSLDPWNNLEERGESNPIAYKISAAPIILLSVMNPKRWNTSGRFCFQSLICDLLHCSNLIIGLISKHIANYLKDWL